MMYEYKWFSQLLNGNEDYYSREELRILNKDFVTRTASMMAHMKWRDAGKLRNGNGPCQNTLKQEQPATTDNGRYKDFVTRTAREMAERKWRSQVEETGYNAGKLRNGYGPCQNTCKHKQPATAENGREGQDKQQQPVPQGGTVIETFGPDTSGVAGCQQPKTGGARAEGLAPVTAQSGKESSGSSELPSPALGEGPAREHEPAKQEIPTKVESRESAGCPNAFSPITDSQKHRLMNTPLFRQLCVAAGCFRTLFFGQPWHDESKLSGPGAVLTLDTGRQALLCWEE
jgi:hypothetical protein